METSLCLLSTSSSSVSVSGAAAADVTGLSRVCIDILSRLDEFVCRLDVIKDNIAHTRECSQLIDQVFINTCKHVYTCLFTSVL